METQRLRNIQSPETVDRLLTTLILRARRVPDESHQIRDAGSLPGALGDVVRKAHSVGRLWQAWTCKDRIWLFTAELLFVASCERGSPVLDVRVYGEDGELDDVGLWTCDRFGEWVRCAE